MSITHTLLTHFANGTPGQSYTTASVTPSANKLQRLYVETFESGAPNTVTVTGCGLTWVEITHVDFDTIATPQQRLTCFRAMGATPTTGTLTISIAGSTNLDCSGTWSEFGNTDTTGTNGSGAIVQSATARSDSATPFTVTLAALADAVNNAVDYGASIGTSGGTWSAGGTYTLISGDDEGAQGVSTGAQFKVPGTTTPGMTYSGGAVIFGAIAIEIAIAGVSVPSSSSMPRATRFIGWTV